MAQQWLSNREVRPIAKGWEHPRTPGRFRADGTPAYRPLFSRADLLEHAADRAANPEDSGEDLGPEHYMPPIPEGQPYDYVLYETTSEGTPVSPAFSSLEELAVWCESNPGEVRDARWTREKWLEVLSSGNLANMLIST
jgi:hypothetical protein